MDAGVPDVRQPVLSGPARHVRHIITGLAHLGHDVRLLARFDDGLWVSDDLERYRPAGGTSGGVSGPSLVERAVRRAQRTLGLPYAAWFESRRFAAACEREFTGFDVVYERMGWMGFGAGLAARRLGIPHVLEVNGDHLFELEAQGMRPGPAQRALSTWLMGRMVRRADGAIATGDGWRGRHIARWHPDPATVSVVPNGTDMVGLLARDELRAFRADGIDGPLGVVFVGAFDPWQGLPLLMGAVARAVGMGADLRFTIVGTGPLEHDIREQASVLGLTGRVHFTGYLPAADLARCLARSDVGVAAYSARGEYSGLKLLDYKAAGLATVTTGADGQPGEIAEGRTGLVVPPASKAAFAMALARCAGDRALVRRLGRQARIDAEARHGWDNSARRIAHELEGVVTSARRSPATGSTVVPSSGI